MKTIALTQGTPKWLAHRAQHFNASDAPAMLGVSPYKTRSQLLRELATGIAPEVDAGTQRRFDDGHRYEAMARPIAEQIIGEELYPCVGVDGKLSASFDGLTLMEDTALEHKTLNDDLRAVLTTDGMTRGDSLPEHYRVQMEQQCMVSGAERVLFMASKWRDDGTLVEERHCWYTPDPALRERIVAGWQQFERDLADYVPEAGTTPAPAGRAPETLPALRVEAQGMVTFSNLSEFRDHAMAVLGSINRDLKTDEDFADAEKTVKWCKGVEDRLDTAKSSVLAQMMSVDEVCRTIDSVSAETRAVRLELDRLVRAEKESRRAEIVAAGVAAVRKHYDTINATLGEHAMQFPGGMPGFIGAAIKGKKTLSSIQDAVDAAVAEAKIDASRDADCIRQNIAVLAEYKEYAQLFADRVTLCASKSLDDLRNLAKARVAEHQKREDERLEAERARIREEEAAKARRAEQLRQQAIAETERARAEQEAPQRTPEPVHTTVTPTPPAPPARPQVKREDGAKVKLGDINASIAPLSISAAGLAALGFTPVGSDRAAKLYAAADLEDMYEAMAAVILDAGSQVRKAG